MISRALIAALIMAESSNRDWVVNGDAAGCLQIRPVVVIDVNAYSKRHFRLEDRLDRKKSIEMLKIYLTYYCGETADDHTLAMTWRYGPSCASRSWIGVGYWREVKKYRDHPELISPYEKQKPNTRGALRRFLTRVASIFGLRRTPVYATHFTQNQHAFVCHSPDAEPHPTRSYD